jgi:hypothetical protein
MFLKPFGELCALDFASCPSQDDALLFVHAIERMTSTSCVILSSDASEGAMDNVFICHASFYARVKGRDLMSEEQDEA